MKPTLDYVKFIAREAGEILQSFIGKDLDVQHKSPTDLVTRADHASEQYLIETIRKSFPDHMINAEEAGQLGGVTEHQWFIDPLDGTLNYAHGVPMYSVSLAYAYQGEIELGVVLDPARDECFIAEKGQGAFLNDAPMQVSGFENLVDCMLVTGFPNNMWDSPDDNTINFTHFSKQAQTVRRLGSAALDMAYTAAGRLDGYWETGIHNWDVAAGGLLIREAGGVVTDYYGKDDFLRDPITVVGANLTIHAKMLEVLAEVREKQQRA
jgi:myo-inositol-1(or 4)-monophosphatase